MLSAAFSSLDSKVLVMTAPDINNGPIKRAPDSVHHTYVFHAIASTHQSYRLGAFDSYDSLLCIGPYQIAEIRKTEEIYRLKKKELLLTGYPLLERIYNEHQEYKKTKQNTLEQNPYCVIAPTWGPSSILETCIHQLIQALANSKFRVLLRPHPEFVKRFPKKVEAIQKSVLKTKNITMQSDLSTLQILHEADLLITDHSGISMEYFLATERPVLFIDTPTRIDNSDVSRIGLEPIENTYRNRLGMSLLPQKMDQVVPTLQTLLNKQMEYADSAPAIRNELVSNWQKSAEIGANYILERCGC
jgi:YidC/Oxa1 family membrane protein insertase